MKRLTRDLLEKVAARYIVTGETIRQVANHFGLSKSTVGIWLKYYSNRLLNFNISCLIQARAESNLLEHKIYGKTLPYYEFDKDIGLDDVESYTNGEINIQIKPFMQDQYEDFMVEEYKNEIEKFRENVTKELRIFGYNDEFIKNNLTDIIIENALLAELSVDDLISFLIKQWREYDK